MPTSVDTNVTVLPSGLALASGVSIAERDGPQALNDPTGDVTWIRPDTGHIAGFVATFRPDSVGAPTQHQTQLGVQNPDDAIPALVLLALEVDNSQSSLNRATVQARNQNNGANAAATIIDALGESSFLQNALGVVKMRCDTGRTATGSFANGNQLTGLTFAHNLGVVPTRVLICPQAIATFGGLGSNVSAVVASCSGLSSTTITYVAQILTGSSNNSCTVDWAVFAP